MARSKKEDIAAIRRELLGEKEVRLGALTGDTATDEGERRRTLIWQNFKLRNGTATNAMVVGEASPNFVEGKEAAAANTAMLFEEELYKSPNGVHVDRLCSIHTHYFGGGFEKTVGKKLRVFIKEKYEYDEKSGLVKGNAKLLNALRKMEMRHLIEEDKAENDAKKRKLTQV